MKKTLLLITMTLCATHAAASDITGASSGQWANFSPSNIQINPTPANALSWGATVPGSVDNLITFSGMGFSGDLGTPFKIGTLSYQNGSIYIPSSNTVDSYADLNLGIQLATPASLSFVTPLNFKFTTTPNTWNAKASADYVYLPAGSVIASFVNAGAEYRLEFSGFANVRGDGYLSSSNSLFHVLEQKSASADLFALLTAKPVIPAQPVQAVPEPETYALMLAGVGMVGWMARRRRSAD